MLRIPDSERPRLLRLASLSDKTVEELALALENTSPVLNSRRFADRVEPRLSTPIPDLEEILGALMSLEAAREAQEVAVEQLAEDVREGMLKSSGEALFAAKPGDVFKSRIARLLQIRSLQLAAKAQGLVTEQKCLFDNARIISDIRPIFDDNPEHTPEGAVVVHTLRVEYWDDAEARSIHFAMDGDDLEELQEVIRRAAVKEKTLRELLASNRLQTLQ